MPARTVARALLRHEGRGRRRRVRASRADGRHQPPLHRRLPRHHVGQQSPGGPARQPHLLGQRARHRPAPRRLAPRAGHERPSAAGDRQLARRRHQRLPARRRLRHHGCLGSDGHLLPRVRSRRSAAAPRQHHRRLHPRQEGRARRRSQGAGRHDRAPQGRALSQPGADARRHAGLHSRRSVRQHRARLQFRAGHHDGVEAGRLCGHRSGLRR